MGLACGTLGIFDHRMKQNIKKKSEVLTGVFSRSAGSRTSRSFGSEVAQSKGFFRSRNHP